MIVHRSASWMALARKGWYVIVPIVGYAVVVVYLDKHEIDADLPIAIPALIGTAISILLGFRTSAAYDRWWEARKIWGSIVNDSRTLARQVLTLIKGDGAATLQHEAVYRQIAWNHALAQSLRGQDPIPGLEGLLPPDEIAPLRTADNVPNMILQTQTIRLTDACRRGLVESILFLPIEDTLKRFSDHMGMCERIKNTVFPAYYSWCMLVSVWLFAILLPPALSPYLGWTAVSVSAVVTLVFFMLESIGRYLEDPFENQITDTPMTALCRSIEINLREQLGETDLPEKIKPIDGILM